MSPKDAIAKLNSLTPRQQEVLKLFCEGISYKEIGETLFIAENTIKTHMGNIYEKLDLLDLSPKERAMTIFDIYCPVGGLFYVGIEINVCHPRYNQCRNWLIQIDRE